MSAPSHDPRSDAQAAHELAMSEVSDVLVNIEHTIARAKKAKRRIGDSAEAHNAQLALADTLRELQRVRSRLQKDAYFSGDELGCATRL
ncbi:MAG TPA: hypothetical protein PLC22_19910 [Gordonia sp. (in: high G+C Gram-positive bacteria)]|nr:hypothetical protein [Gordonia sp. (in: high G+C Gram-positive bacteria)]